MLSNSNHASEYIFKIMCLHEYIEFKKEKKETPLEDAT